MDLEKSWTLYGPPHMNSFYISMEGGGVWGGVRNKKAIPDQMKIHECEYNYKFEILVSTYKILLKPWQAY